MTASLHLPAAVIDLEAIRHNYQVFTKYLTANSLIHEPFAQAWGPFLPVVKADAYGHGHIRVAKALVQEGAKSFASGSVEEAAELRRGLAPGMKKEGAEPFIVALLGLITMEDALLAADHAIIPVLHSFSQIPLLKGAKGLPLRVAIKCNTGMARLGFAEEDLPRLAEELKQYPSVSPVLTLSHLACADSAGGVAEVQKQARVFGRMLTVLRGFWPGIAVSLCNSAGTMLAGHVEKEIGPHLCRVGISLYGGNPFFGTPHENLGEGLLPAMAVSTPVMAVRTLRAGQGIGYGHTFAAGRDMRVGIIAAGYADGYLRSLSNRGKVYAGTSRVPILGRISMQMTAIDLTEAPGVAEGDLVWLLGGPQAREEEKLPGARVKNLEDAASTPCRGEASGPIKAEELAAECGTISYEVLCLLGNNTRVYVTG